ncbi:MAG: transcriptional regulator with XRE-family HTH domain [Planctomycetota bacterium]|jgi:transcriptional regulator with XRE-family HTH domain
MNLVRLLREQAGVTQQELALMAGTSQSTIAAYESEKKSPSLRTMEKLADSVGLTMAASYVPKLTREDQRSIAYHRAIAKLIYKDPKTVLDRARANLNKISRIHPGAKKLTERWGKWLRLPVDELVENLLDSKPKAREMRQVSPFSGLLNPADRIKILKQFQLDYHP